MYYNLVADKDAQAMNIQVLEMSLQCYILGWQGMEWPQKK